LGFDPLRSRRLAPVKPVGIDKVNAAFKDPDGRWFATTGYFAGFCVNTEVLKEKQSADVGCDQGGARRPSWSACTHA
jgi:ABC-type Fe3+ transport system substrate-binding protein